MACCDVIVLISFPGPSLSGETQNRLSSPICFSVLFSQMLAGLDQGLLFLLSPCVSLVVFFPCSLGGFLNCGSDPAGLWGCGVWGGCGGVMWGGAGCHTLYKYFPTEFLPWPCSFVFYFQHFCQMYPQILPVAHQSGSAQEWGVGNLLSPPFPALSIIIVVQRPVR